MNRVIDIFSYIFCGLISSISFILGGFDGLMITLIWFSIIDYITGVLSALYNEGLDSSKCGKGIIKKISIYTVVSIAVFLNKYIGIPAVREMTVLFYIGREGISIMENIGEIDDGEIPKRITDALKELKERNNKKEDDK